MNKQVMKVGGRIAAVAGVCAVALLSTTPPASTAGGPPEKVNVIIQYTEPPGQSERNRVRGHGAEIKREFQNFKMLALRVPVNALHGLAQGNRVESISIDEPVMGFSSSARATAKVPNPGQVTYVTPASDVRVAVLDSGVSSSHWDVDLAKTVDILPAYLGGGNVLDEFSSPSYTGNDGTFSWKAGWQEVGESNGPMSGYVQVDGGAACTGCLAFKMIGTSAVGATREVDLSDRLSAELTVSDVFMWGQGVVRLVASPDGGSSWALLHAFDGGSDVSEVTVDLTPYMSSNTRISLLSQSGAEGKFTAGKVEIVVDGGPGNDPKDPFGHGTHVSSAASGDGNSSNGDYPGVARGAPIVSVRVLDHNGRGFASDVIAGLDWVLSNQDAEQIRVVNLSLGQGISESADTDPLVAAVEAVWDAGIVVVCSAGNYGTAGNFTITSPANSRKVITVGSLTDNGNPAYQDDYVSTFSSMGPTLIDHYLKPDLVAPGNRFIAAIPESKLKKILPERGRCGDCAGGTYLELSGTSMAAGVVSGAVAMMLSQDPSSDAGDRQGSPDALGPQDER